MYDEMKRFPLFVAIKILCSVTLILKEVTLCEKCRFVLTPENSGLKESFLGDEC